MKCKSHLATALKNALERYTRLAEETHQMYEQACIEAESEDFENFHGAFINECFEVLQAQTSEFKNLVWLSDNFWMIIERDGTTLWDIVQRARSIEATLKRAVERARGECEHNRLVMSDLNIKRESDEEDEQNAPVQTKCKFSRNGSKELRSRTVYYQLC